MCMSYVGFIPYIGTRVCPFNDPEKKENFTSHHVTLDMTNERLVPAEILRQIFLFKFNDPTGKVIYKRMDTSVSFRSSWIMVGHRNRQQTLHVDSTGEVVLVLEYSSIGFYFTWYVQVHY